jgi:hypothetical protein
VDGTASTLYVVTIAGTKLMPEAEVVFILMDQLIGYIIVSIVDSSVGSHWVEV